MRTRASTSYRLYRPSAMTAAVSMVLALCAQGHSTPARAASPAGYSAPSATITWLAAAGDADIEKAFAQGKAEKKPVLVYWGAKWCPPCNQLKATLFNRQDFAERAKHFVAVNIDGDLPGAQKLGARFKVRGYPTMILFNPDGTEITRLPGEVDAPMVMNVLQMGLAGGRPVKTVLAEARAGKPVTSNEWRMLAYYAWDTDEAQLVPAPERPGLLAQLSAACPPAEADTAMRLLLKSLAESDEGKGVKPDAALRDKIRKMLADPAATRSQMDVVVNYSADLARALAPQPGADRSQMVAAFDAALQRLQADMSLSRSDRMSAVIGRVELARIDLPKETLQPKMPEALSQQVKSEVSKADTEITDGYERQAVITSAAHLLGQAGLWKESDALLKANLSKSHSPYYLMSQLGGNAKKQGRSAEALDWYGQAFAKSEGPATRLQWGSSYLSALVDMAPQDAKRIEQTASQLITEAANQQGAFYERSARSLQRVGQKLASWNSKGEHKDVIQRLRQQITPVCAKLPTEGGQKAVCEGVIKA